MDAFRLEPGWRGRGNPSVQNGVFTFAATHGGTDTFVSDSTESGRLSFDIGGPGAAGTTVRLDNVSIMTAPSAIAPAGKAGGPILAQVGNRLVLRGAGELVVRDLSGRMILSRRISGGPV